MTVPGSAVVRMQQTAEQVGIVEKRLRRVTADRFAGGRDIFEATIRPQPVFPVRRVVREDAVVHLAVTQALVGDGDFRLVPQTLAEIDHGTDKLADVAFQRRQTSDMEFADEWPGFRRDEFDRTNLAGAGFVGQDHGPGESAFVFGVDQATQVVLAKMTVVESEQARRRVVGGMDQAGAINYQLSQREMRKQPGEARQRMLRFDLRGAQFGILDFQFGLIDAQVFDQRSHFDIITGKQLVGEVEFAASQSLAGALQDAILFGQCRGFGALRGWAHGVGSLFWLILSKLITMPPPLPRIVPACRRQPSPAAEVWPA